MVSSLPYVAEQIEEALCRIALRSSVSPIIAPVAYTKHQQNSAKCSNPKKITYCSTTGVPASHISARVTPDQVHQGELALRLERHCIMISFRVERVTHALAAGHQDRGLIVQIHGIDGKRTEGRDTADVGRGGGGQNVNAGRWKIGGGCEKRKEDGSPAWEEDGEVLRALGEGKVLGRSLQTLQARKRGKGRRKRLGYQGSPPPGNHPVCSHFGVTKARAFSP